MRELIIDDGNFKSVEYLVEKINLSDIKNNFKDINLYGSTLLSYDGNIIEIYENVIKVDYNSKWYYVTITTKYISGVHTNNHINMMKDTILYKVLKIF